MPQPRHVHIRDCDNNLSVTHVLQNQLGHVCNGQYISDKSREYDTSPVVTAEAFVRLPFEFACLDDNGLLVVGIDAYSLPEGVKNVRELVAIGAAPRTT